MFTGNDLQSFNMVTGIFMNEIVIETPKNEYADSVKKHWDRIAKPLDGLGKFEYITARIGAIKGQKVFSLAKKTVLVFCSDNGIVEEGVSQSPSDVTLRVMNNMLRGKSSMAVMAKGIGAKTYIVDIGVDCSLEDILPEKDRDDSAKFLDCKVRRGSRNFAKEPAMTEEETKKAIQIGIDLVGKLSEEGMDIIALGEMGIGNTTTSSAVSAAITGKPVELLVGRGAGLDDEGLKRKREIISRALEKYNIFLNEADRIIDAGTKSKALHVLQCMGGFDLAALTGAVIGGAVHHVPIVLDGVITMTAALVASKIAPGCLQYGILSHKGKEPAVEILEEELIKAGAICDSTIQASMALGEGSGAVMMLSLLDLTMEVYHNAAVFEDLTMEQYTRFDSKK